MKISAQEEYGLRCLLQLALAESKGESLTLAQIARREGISFSTEDSRRGGCVGNRTARGRGKCIFHPREK